MKIAAILTCHNRKVKTEICLSSLFHVLPKCEVFLVDDGSTDGTSEMVSRKFPNVHLLHGSGNLFWNRGMYTAWTEAQKGDFEYYLWLNDDVTLYSDFFDELLNCYNLSKGNTIITGLVEDETKTKIIYGGYDESRKMIQPSSALQKVKYMNGNVVLVSKDVVERIGILDPYYHHDLGDVDYGLRAMENNISVYATRKVVACGSVNNICRERKWGVSLITRFRILYSPLGSNPSICFYFRRKHYGILNASAYYVFLHVLNLMSDGMVRIIFGRKYIGG